MEESMGGKGSFREYEFFSGFLDQFIGQIMDVRMGLCIILLYNKVVYIQQYEIIIIYYYGFMGWRDLFVSLVWVQLGDLFFIVGSWVVLFYFVFSRGGLGWRGDSYLCKRIGGGI